MKVTDSEVTAIIEQTADYLDKYGWEKGRMGHHGWPRCARGALESVTGHYDGLRRGVPSGWSALIQYRATSLQRQVRFEAAYKVLCKEVGTSVEYWNDRHRYGAGRQVIAELRGIVAKRRLREAPVPVEAAVPDPVVESDRVLVKVG